MPVVFGGTDELYLGKRIEIRVLPAVAPPAGTYKLKCSHTFHKFFGMSGTIIVR